MEYETYCIYKKREMDEINDPHCSQEFFLTDVIVQRNITFKDSRWNSKVIRITFAIKAESITETKKEQWIYVQNLKEFMKESCKMLWKNWKSLQQKLQNKDGEKKANLTA